MSPAVLFNITADSSGSESFYSSLSFLLPTLLPRMIWRRHILPLRFQSSPLLFCCLRPLLHQFVLCFLSPVVEMQLPVQVSPYQHPTGLWTVSALLLQLIVVILKSHYPISTYVATLFYAKD